MKLIDKNLMDNLIQTKKVLRLVWNMHYASNLKENISFECLSFLEGLDSSIASIEIVTDSVNYYLIYYPCHSEVIIKDIIYVLQYEIDKGEDLYYFSLNKLGGYTSINHVYLLDEMDIATLLLLDIPLKN